MIKRMINVDAMFVEALSIWFRHAQEKKGDPAQRQHPRSAKAEVVEETGKDEPSTSASSTDDKSNEPTVKSLLEEATKVLKTWLHHRQHPGLHLRLQIPKEIN